MRWLLLCDKQMGPSDSGKSYRAKALGIAACNSCKSEP